MGMEMLLDNLSALSQNPFAWAVAAMVALRALFSVFMSVRCPVQRGIYQPTQEEAEKAANEVFQPPLATLILMILGMALATGGLYMVADTDYGALALAAMVIGVFIFMTEPSRLAVVGAVKAVYASSLHGEDANLAARHGLRGAQIQRSMIEVAIATVVFATLVFL